MDDQAGASRQKILTAQEVSDYLKIPLSTIYDLAAKGKLRGVKFGKHWRFLEADILSYLHGNQDFINHPAVAADKRNFPRINTTIAANVTGMMGDAKVIHQGGEIRNLSEEGALFVPVHTFNRITEQGTGDQNIFGLWLEEEQAFVVGDQVKVIFEIPNQQQDLIEIEGRVVHQVKNHHTGIGIKFRNITQRIRGMLHDYVG
ncbi:MAG: helix-turn-helix domain-containing protein [Candidatus Omnitrophica bacterium]|nr:helix-turn-helix domain-containing protein [Candidatus Omnitrophota bacterium]MDD5670878.1 helix-turn-helix domain-containing protein [Candidatus Omnitrophota bacterium]